MQYLFMSWLFLHLILKAASQRKSEIFGSDKGSIPSSHFAIEHKYKV